MNFWKLSVILHSSYIILACHLTCRRSRQNVSERMERWFRLDTALEEMLSHTRMREGWLFTFITMGEVVKVGHMVVKVNWGLCVWYIHFRGLFLCKTGRSQNGSERNIRQSWAKLWVWQWQIWHLCIWQMLWGMYYMCAPLGSNPLWLHCEHFTSWGTILLLCQSSEHWLTLSQNNVTILK